MKKLSNYEIIDNMDKIMRFSGTTNIKPQVLSSHTLRVAVLAWQFAKHRENIDYQKLFMAAITHDAEETFCGDIVSPIKKYFAEYALSVMNIMDDHVEDPDFLYYFKQHRGLEYQYVELADLIDTPLQALNEYKLGNKSHIRYFDKFVNFMSESSNVYYLNSILDRDNIELFIKTYHEIQNIVSPYNHSI